MIQQLYASLQFLVRSSSSDSLQPLVGKSTDSLQKDLNTALFPPTKMLAAGITVKYSSVGHKKVNKYID